MDNKRFEALGARPSVDNVLGRVQMHHVQLSSLADTKAGLLITISSIVLTIALTRTWEAMVRPAVVTLAAASLISLLLAIVAVLPTFAGGRRASGRNLLFFGHFGALSEDEFLDEMTRVLSTDQTLYETALRDIYSHGKYLYRKKYRFLRYAYVALLAGFILATAVEVWVIAF